MITEWNSLLNYWQLNFPSKIKRVAVRLGEAIYMVVLALLIIIGLALAISEIFWEGLRD